METPKLNRTLSLPQMVLYGLGTTIGAGIYALVGELAGISGYLAPAAFLVAAILAGMTAMSFAELSGRYPQAAGAALYVKQGFDSDRFSTLVGLLVALAGLVSASALVNGFIGYLSELLPIHPQIDIIILVFLIGALAAWGIAESVFIASLITLIEVGGLLLIIYTGLPSLENLGEIGPHFIPDLSFTSVSLIYSGVLLAFFAFIGFEDMVDVAEEVKDVSRTLPRAILLTLSITAIIYICIMVIALLSFTPAELAKSQAPMALLYEHHTGNSATLITFIGMFAIINGALIQVIMASRVLYGLSCRGLIPKPFCRVNARTHTPVISTFTASLVVLILALLGELSSLAQATSIIMLAVFSMVNLALWRIKKHQPAPYGNLVIPRWVPLVGFIVSSGFVIFELSNLVL
ncbi:amino acid permease [Thiomicrorhabdus sp. ZW0627]|uniref:APC family permease n=1 Tax=Thiomicrorhabdus sp. ZW0627 TaxID=3039774 RepID=UPI0024370E1B|nr:amino acid permease [Thiomicrorhabdus sp. ZW0627]MDG6773238.1 amino acid permease [Thiomicrorhabdus sp. ZW0627]